MDFGAKREVDGGIAGDAVGIDGDAEDAGVGPGSALEATMGVFSVAAVLGAAADATGAEAGFCALAGASFDWAGAGAGAAEVVALEAAGAAAGTGGAAAAFAERVIGEAAF